MKAYELLDSPAKWTQREEARDAYGNPVDARDDQAVQWCMAGAIFRCYPGQYVGPLERLEHVIGKDYSIGHRNDDSETTFDDVQSWLRRADV